MNNLKTPSKYLEGNQLKRTRLVNPIKRGEISKIELDSLLRAIESDIANQYLKDPFDKNTVEKVSSEQWNEQYLERLASQGIDGECFNKEYLLYLYEVTRYIRQRKTMSKYRLGAIGIGACVLIVLLSFCGIFLSKKKNNNPQNEAIITTTSSNTNDSISDVTADTSNDKRQDSPSDMTNDKNSKK